MITFRLFFVNFGIKWKLGSVKDGLVNLHDASFKHLDILLLENTHIVVPGRQNFKCCFLLFSLVPDVVDISHFEPGDKDGGQGDDIVGEVAPLTVNQALLNKVVDVFSELDHHLN